MSGFLVRTINPMRTTLRQLKRLIREVAVSPSVFQNNKLINDPFEKPSVAKALQAIEPAFKTAIAMNMVLAEKDSYNAETREFDDAAYQRIEEVAQKATEMMVARVKKA